MVSLPPVHPAFDFLCASLRFARGAETIDALSAAASAAGDWRLAAQGARTHRVLAAFDAALRALPDSARPHEVADEAARRRRAQAHRALAKSAQLAELSSQLAADGRRALVLKGVPLALKLYGTLDARGVGDIDFLVAPPDFRPAAECLARLGYVPVGGTLERLMPRGYEASRRDIVFRHPQLPGEVEIHQRFAANRLRLETDFDRLWRARETTHVAGVEVATLPVDMLGPYLCAHGIDHCWERLIWLEDLVRLAARLGGTAPLLAQAQTEDLARPMALALALGAGWLGLEPAIDAPPAEEIDGFVRAFFEGEHALAPPPKTGFRALRRRLRYRRHMLTVKTGWRARAGEIGAVLADPVDWNRVPVPRGWTWLHVLLRPLGVGLRVLRDLYRR